MVDRDVVDMDLANRMGRDQVDRMDRDQVDRMDRDRVDRWIGIEWIGGSGSSGSLLSTPPPRSFSTPPGLLRDSPSAQAPSVLLEPSCVFHSRVSLSPSLPP